MECENQSRGDPSRIVELSIALSFCVHRDWNENIMSSRRAKENADIPDIHAESVEELREAFNLFDTAGAGEISVSELVDSMQTLGFQDKNPMMFEIMLKISAKRKGGNITFAKFAEDVAELIRGVNQEKDMRMVFDMLDVDNTGRISLDNLKKVANEFGENRPEAELIEMLDTAKIADTEGLGEGDEQLSNNEVSFPDFYRFMTKGKSGVPALAASPNI